MARYNKLIGKLSAEEASNVLYKNAESLKFNK